MECMIELKTIVRIKKEVKRYFRKHKEHKEIEEDLLRIIEGERA